MKQPKPLVGRYREPAEKISMVREGLSKYQLTDLKSQIGVDFDQLAEILGTSRATLINKKEDQRFDARVSERMLLVAELVAFGREIFGEDARFNEWLKTTSPALGGVKPLSLLDTIFGMEEIRKELGRIAHGIY